MDSQAAAAVKLIVGNKCDLEESRSVPRNHAQKLAEEIGCRYLEASAMTGQNVEESFNSMIQAILVKKGVIADPISLTSSTESLSSPRRASIVDLGEDGKPKDSACC